MPYSASHCADRGISNARASKRGLRPLAGLHRQKKGASVGNFNRASLVRAFELMETYADRPMDLVDASIIVAAEELETRTVFAIDRNDFQTYRVRRGHRYRPLQIVR